MGGGGSGGQDQPSETKTTTTPWAGQQPYLEDIYKKAQAAYGQTSQTPYSGRYVASPSTEQQQGQQALVNTAQGLQGSGNEVMALGQQQAQGQYLSPESNPYLQQSMQAALNPVFQRFQTETLPQLRSNAIAQGAYSGNRNAITEGLAAQGMQRQAADTTAQMALQNLSNERQLQQNSGQLIQQGANLNLAYPQQLLTAGDISQGWSQDMINEALAQYSGAQNAPWNGMQQYGGVVLSGSPGQSTVSNTAYNPLKQSTGSMVAGGLSGAAGGAMMGSMFGPWGTAIGAGVGGLAGLFGR